MLFLRALISFLVLPGTVAGLIPAWIVSTDHGRGHGLTLGAVPLAIGVVMLLRCVRDFYESGKGTLAPWDPPKVWLSLASIATPETPCMWESCCCLAGGVSSRHRRCLPDTLSSWPSHFICVWCFTKNRG